MLSTDPTDFSPFFNFYFLAGYSEDSDYTSDVNFPIANAANPNAATSQYLQVVNNPQQPQQLQQGQDSSQQQFYDQQQQPNGAAAAVPTDPNQQQDFYNQQQQQPQVSLRHRQLHCRGRSKRVKV